MKACRLRSKAVPFDILFTELPKPESHASEVTVNSGLPGQPQSFFIYPRKDARQ
jgi:hypothetical protein